MINESHRKKIAKEKMYTAIENFKKAKSSGAKLWAPVTYRWAKGKIYEDRKIILNPHSSDQDIEEAANDASAASAQLLSAVAEHEKVKPAKSEFNEKEAINNLVSEGGPII